MPSRRSRTPVPRGGALRFALPIALLGAAPLVASCGGESRPHNVVLISIDTMRPDYLGAYGYQRGVSPRIDAVAEAGVVFEDVTSASPWTLPSHASMLTGLYPTTHGVRGPEFRLENEDLAGWFGASGYQTFAVVNTQNVGNPRYGLLEDFDRAEWVPEIDWNYETNQPASKILDRAEPIIQTALGFLRERDPERPFFLFLHFYDVHTDYTPLPKWEAEYVTPYDGPLEGMVTQELANLRNRVQRAGTSFAEEDLRYLREMYDAEIRTFDERLAVFFDFLEAGGLEDETLVAITSDHGEEYGEHGSILHGRTHYQELVRIPWILRGPGVPAGARVEEPVHLVDVAPTLVALAGLRVPPGLDGVDASLAWRAPGSFPERLLYSEADHNALVDGKTRNDIKSAVRYGNHVLHWDTVTDAKELYDLTVDPTEQRDLAAEEPDLVDFLYERLRAFRSGAGNATHTGEISEEEQRNLDALGYGGGE